MTGVEMLFPGGFSVHAEPHRAASLRAACAAKPQHPGWRGSCCQLKAAVVHDAHLAHPSTPGLQLALAITLPRGAQEGRGTAEVLEAMTGSPGAARCCVVLCE